MFKKIAIAIGMLVLTSLVSCSKLRTIPTNTNYVYADPYAYGNAFALFGSAHVNNNAQGNANMQTGTASNAGIAANLQFANQHNSIIHY